MKDEMPQNQAELDEALLAEDKKEILISNLASSWIYEKLVTNVRRSDKHHWHSPPWPSPTEVDRYEQSCAMSFDSYRHVLTMRPSLKVRPLVS